MLDDTKQSTTDGGGGSGSRSGGRVLIGSEREELSKNR